MVGRKNAWERYIDFRLQTHCVVLDEAQRQGWRNALLLNFPTVYIQDDASHRAFDTPLKCPFMLPKT